MRQRVCWWRVEQLRSLNGTRKDAEKEIQQKGRKGLDKGYQGELLIQ